MNGWSSCGVLSLSNDRTGTSGLKSLVSGNLKTKAVRSLSTLNRVERRVLKRAI